MADIELSFWEHLDVLKGCLLRIIVVTVVCAAVAFGFKEWMFGIVLAPSRSDFIVYNTAVQRKILRHDLN